MSAIALRKTAVPTVWRNRTRKVVLEDEAQDANGDGGEDDEPGQAFGVVSAIVLRTRVRKKDEISAGPFPQVEEEEGDGVGQMEADDKGQVRAFMTPTPAAPGWPVTTDPGGISTVCPRLESGNNSKKPWIIPEDDRLEERHVVDRRLSGSQVQGALSSGRGRGRHSAAVIRLICRASSSAGKYGRWRVSCRRSGSASCPR